jgi:N utilization substance protein B
MPTRRRERRARLRALQALYAADVRASAARNGPAASSVPLRVAELVFDDLAVEPGVRALAAEHLRTVIERDEEIVAALEHATANWRLNRLGAIERSVLRLGAAELVAGVTPPRVVLQEFVRLAERFAGMESARFVNGVLDAVARALGRL